jgi:hypothetical protein
MGHLKRAVIAVSGGVFALMVAVHAETGANGRRFESRDRSAPRVDSSRIVTAPGRASTLRIHRVRLEAAPPAAPKPSVLLKFDLVNDGLLTVRNVVLEVAIVERPSIDAATAALHVVAGPFTIRGDIDLQAGYTLNYEMLLRNLPSDCNCSANVAILSGGTAARSGATIAR